MFSDTERAYNERPETESPVSEEFSSSPWSVLSEHGANEDFANGPLMPVAIIGMSCRLPGSAQDPSSLWEMLISGRTAWTPGPGRRFNMKAFQDPSGVKAGTVSSQEVPSCMRLVWLKSLE
jgi:emericellamide synthase (highly reducing iterative type I polyketide synthase)